MPAPANSRARTSTSACHATRRGGRDGGVDRRGLPDSHGEVSSRIRPAAAFVCALHFGAPLHFLSHPVCCAPSWRKMLGKSSCVGSVLSVRSLDSVSNTCLANCKVNGMTYIASATCQVGGSPGSALLDIEPVGCPVCCVNSMCPFGKRFYMHLKQRQLVALHVACI